MDQKQHEGLKICWKNCNVRHLIVDIAVVCLTVYSEGARSPFADRGPHLLIEGGASLEVLPRVVHLSVSEGEGISVTDSLMLGDITLLIVLLLGRFFMAEVTVTGESVSIVK